MNCFHYFLVKWARSRSCLFLAVREMITTGRWCWRRIRRWFGEFMKFCIHTGRLELLDVLNLVYIFQLASRMSSKVRCWLLWMRMLVNILLLLDFIVTYGCGAKFLESNPVSGKSRMSGSGYTTFFCIKLRSRLPIRARKDQWSIPGRGIEFFQSLSAEPL